MPFRHQATIGEYATSSAASDRADGAAPSPALTTPVGVRQDVRGNVWVADSANSRVVVFDASLDRRLAVVGARGSEPGSFDLPFRFAHHPVDRAILVTDIGNGRVQRLAYEYSGGVPAITDVEAFSPDDGERFHPNGIATHEYDDGVRIFVADEFYHQGADLRGRIAVFDDTGALVDSIRSVDSAYAGSLPLYWPQGLGIDGEGHLLIANTGEGVLRRSGAFPPYFATVLRCDRSGRGVPFDETGTPIVPQSFVTPRGVSVLGAGEDERIAVPDVGGGFVRMYDTDLGHTSEVPSDIAPSIDDRRLGSPMHVAPFEGPGGSDSDDTTARVLVSEALDHSVAAYDLGTISETKERLAAVETDRSDPGQFDYPSAAVGVPTSGGVRLALVDGDNARVQLTGADGTGPLTPLGLTHNRFPVGTAFWSVEPGRGYLFVADYSLSYDTDNDEPQIAVYELDCHDDARIDHVTSVGTWGIWGNNCKLPRGLALDEIDGERTRLLVTDSFNGRLLWWTFDRTTGELTYEDDGGGFGHDAGEFWNPSDVAVGDHATYVTDRNNNRLQSFDGDEWRVHGEAGYGTDGDRFLLPQSVATAGEYVFVVDLVDRAIKAYRETGPHELAFCDAMQAFGGDRSAGDLWMPSLLGARRRGDGVELTVPDSVLNVVYRYHWTPPA